MKISYTLPPNKPKCFETDKDCIIFGRKPGPGQHVDIDLRPDSYVSRVHARLTFQDNKYWLEDLNSANGSYIDEKRISKKTPVNEGSKLKIGWTIIEIREVVKTDKMGPVPSSADEVTIIRDCRAPAAEPEKKQGGLMYRNMKVSDSDVTIIRDDDSVTSFNPAPEGTITSVRDVLTPPFSPLEDEEISEDTHKHVKNHLKVLNNIVQALGEETSVEGLGDILVSELKKAMPQAQRGALLLPDSTGELLLKAHWPSGNHSVSMTFVNRAFTRHEAFIWNAEKPDTDTVSEEAPKSALYYDVQSAIYLPLISAGEKLGVMYVDNYLTKDAFSQTDFELLRAISNHVAMYLNEHVLRKDLQREETVKSNLLRQYSPKIAQKILQKSANLQRGGERIDPVTILVSDIRGFTALSAKMEPDDVVRALNEMFDAFVPIVSEMDGIVDKYVGDSLLAVFGSPEKDPHQWEKAVNAGIKMQEAMRMLGEGRKIRRLPAFQVGIGIHTGAVIHGFIGSSERIEFTVIGDTVNQAARFCDGAGSEEIVISKKVFERVYHRVDVKPKTITTKHPDREPDLEGYIIRGLKNNAC